MYDELTKNESFLKMRDFLSANEIKNDSFMLEITDNMLPATDTRTVDDIIYEIYKRHTENRTTHDDEEYIDHVRAELSTNIWFFFRELLHIPVPGHNQGVQFQLLPHLMEAIYLYSKNIPFILESPRQTGRSLLLRSFALREMLLHNDLDIIFGELNVDGCKRERSMMHDLVVANFRWISLLYPEFIKTFKSFKGQENITFAVNDLNTDPITKTNIDIYPSTCIFVPEYEYSKIDWTRNIYVTRPYIFCAESCYKKIGNDRLKDPSLFYIDHILPQLTVHNLQIYDYDNVTLQLFFPNVINIAHIIYRPEDIPGLEENTERMTAILRSEEALRREWFLK